MLLGVVEGLGCVDVADVDVDVAESFRAIFRGAGISLFCMLRSLLYCLYMFSIQREALSSSLEISEIVLVLISGNRNIGGSSASASTVSGACVRPSRIPRKEPRLLPVSLVLIEAGVLVNDFAVE